VNGLSKSFISLVAEARDFNALDTEAGSKYQEIGIACTQQAR